METATSSRNTGIIKTPVSRVEGYSSANRKMSFVKHIKSSLEISQIVLGMVVDIKVVTDEHGYDFKLTVHTLTKDEKVVNKHEVFITADGQSLNDLKLNTYGKFILCAMDEHGRGSTLMRGRLEWTVQRWVAFCSVELPAASLSRPHQ